MDNEVIGVRAQAMMPNGSFFEDFCFEVSHLRNSQCNSAILNVRNAPSPAATSSLAIAEEICDRAQQLFALQLDTRSTVAETIDAE